MARASDGQLRAQPHQLVAIPYFAWANRGMGEMEVWLPREAGRARVAPIRAARSDRGRALLGRD